MGCERDDCFRKAEISFLVALSYIILQVCGPHMAIQETVSKLSTTGIAVVSL